MAPATARAAGHTYYVSTTGSDGNPGTLERPWATPQHAVDHMSPGDTTLVFSGVYVGQVDCSSGDGGSAGGGYVSLRAYPGTRPVLTGAFGAIVEMSCDYFDVEGFDIAGPSIVNGTNVYPEDGSDHVRLIGNDIHGAICQGISMDAGTSNYEIIRNRIYDNGNRATACDEQAHGLYLQGDGHVVMNNLVYGNHNYGIQRYPQGSDSVIAYNTVVFNGLTTGKSGMVIGSESSDQHVSGDIVTSNVIAFNGGWGIHHAAYGPTSCDIHGNLVYGNPEGDIEGGFPAGCVGPNKSADPLFLDAAKRNLHLSPGSPAIDIGDASHAPSTDFDGTPRPQGAGFDVGAFEYSTQPVPPPPPGPPPPGSKPTLKSRPVLHGKAKKGRTLRASAGKWQGARPLRVSFQWRRCKRHGSRCVTVAQGRRPRHRLTRADVGRKLFVVVTATNAYGSATARTRTSAVVRR